MNLFITPHYKAHEMVIKCCENLDKNAKLPFFHIVVDDNSPNGLPDIKITENRILLSVKSDVDPNLHTMNMGTCMDMALDYARKNLKFDHFFHLESDVMPKKNFDADMLEIASGLFNWGTLDLQSVDENGATTYPDTINHRIEAADEEDKLDILPHTDFQCTLFNPEVMSVFNYTDVASHYDILISNIIFDKTGRFHYRTRKVQAIHYAGTSREMLPKL